MKKKISFEKKIDFPTMIGEICAVSLEPDLSFIDESNVQGELLLSGTYKMTEASRLEEEFHYKIPIEIALSERINLQTSRIDITDFTYTIENEDTMNCHIELQIEGLEILEEKEDERECDGDPDVEKEIEIPSASDVEVVEKAEVESHNEEIKEESSSLFTHLMEEEETYGTFVVYVVQPNESIQSILDKFNISMEEFQQYNDVDVVQAGLKLIIPLSHE